MSKRCIERANIAAAIFPAMLSVLPPEIINMIIAYLDDASKLELMKTCRTFAYNYAYTFTTQKPFCPEMVKWQARHVFLDVTVNRQEMADLLGPNPALPRCKTLSLGSSFITAFTVPDSVATIKGGIIRALRCGANTRYVDGVSFHEIKNADDLIELNVSECDIEVLPMMPKLKKLNIGETQITQLPEGMVELEELDATESNLRVLPHLPALKQLYVGFSDITALPPMPQLTHLDARSTGIRDFSGMPSLIHLCSPFHRIVGPWSNIQYFQAYDVSGHLNLIVMENLRELDVSNSIGEGAEEEEISIGDNRVLSIRVGPLVQIIRCANNRISAITAPGLLELYAENNKLRTLSRMPYLKRLDISHNPIKFGTSRAFDWLVNLRAVSCSLTSLPDFPNLEVLDITGNPITEITAWTLRELIANRCELTTLPKCMPLLTRLEASNNLLQKLPLMPKIETLKISNNWMLRVIHTSCKQLECDTFTGDIYAPYAEKIQATSSVIGKLVVSPRLCKLKLTSSTVRMLPALLGLPKFDVHWTAFSMIHESNVRFF